MKRDYYETSHLTLEGVMDVLKKVIPVGIILVEICDASLINNINVEAALENEYPEVAVIKNDCQSYCGICRVRPYALVNNRRVFGKTPEACLQKIKQAIDEELAFYA